MTTAPTCTLANMHYCYCTIIPNKKVQPDNWHDANL